MENPIGSRKKKKQENQLLTEKQEKYTNTPTYQCFFWMIGVIWIIYYTIKLKRIKIRVKDTCHLAFKSKTIIKLCKNI